MRILALDEFYDRGGLDRRNHLAVDLGVLVAEAQAIKAALGRAAKPNLLELATASALNNRYCITGGEGLPEGLVELVIRKRPFCAWCFRPGGIPI